MKRPPAPKTPGTGKPVPGVLNADGMRKPGGRRNLRPPGLTDGGILRLRSGCVLTQTMCTTNIHQGIMIATVNTVVIAILMALHLAKSFRVT